MVDIVTSCLFRDSCNLIVVVVVKLCKQNKLLFLGIDHPYKQDIILP